jgi:SAM-dependent methyltransferase
MKNYRKLSSVYDLEWGDFAVRFAGFVAARIKDRGLIEAKVLDLACGTGTLAIALADRGHRVLGIDGAPEMIALARAKAGPRTGVTFEVQDIRRFEAGSGFGLVTCSFDAINYILRPSDLESVFRGVAAALAENGIFVFDSNTRRQYLESSLGRRELVLGGRRLSQSWNYNPLKRVATTTFIFDDGSREVHNQRPYDLAELGRLLSRAGLVFAGTWSSPDEEPFRPDSLRLYAVAEKGRGVPAAKFNWRRRY